MIGLLKLLFISFNFSLYLLIFRSIIMSASSTSSSSTSCPEGGEPSGSCKSSDEGESTLKKRMQQYGIASGYANSSISTLDRVRKFFFLKNWRKNLELSFIHASEIFNSNCQQFYPIFVSKKCLNC